MLVPGLIVLLTVFFIRMVERSQHSIIKQFLNWIPAILLAYLLPAIASGVLQKDYSADAIHTLSRNLFIPFAIVSVMSSLSLGQLRSIGWKPILVFLSGSFWIALFPIVLIFFLKESSFVQITLLEAEFWKGIPPIVGSWIGGSTSQLVLKELVACPEGVFLTLLVLDNILVNLWTLFMFQGIKKSNFLNRIMGINAFSPPDVMPPESEQKMNPLLVFLLLIASVACVSFFISEFIIQILVLSGIGLFFSNTIKQWNFSFVLKLGSLLILIVMAILGLKLKVELIQFDFAFLGFLLVWLVSHFIFMLFVAKALQVNSAWVPIASMANVGGIATAPAVTAAYEKKWMPHAIILAVLSMATGTLWGMLTIALFRYFIL